MVCLTKLQCCPSILKYNAWRVFWAKFLKNCYRSIVDRTVEGKIPEYLTIYVYLLLRNILLCQIYINTFNLCPAVYCALKSQMNIIYMFSWIFNYNLRFIKSYRNNLRNIMFNYFSDDYYLLWDLKKHQMSIYNFLN